MKHSVYLFLMLSAFLMFCGCDRNVPEPAEMLILPEATMETVAEFTEESPVVDSQETSPAETVKAPDPEFYVPGIAAEEVIRYFTEVCLDAEMINSGNPTLLQKWQSPIRYMIYGDPTEEDLASIGSMEAWLNTIEGFPGLHQTQDAAAANLRIHFCSEQEMTDLMGQQFSGLDGAVTFWYEQDVIFDAIICCRKDLDQHLRNSVILEELYNGLGPVQDTQLRPDSIIYAAYSEPQALTQMDELILRLLYHPSLTCGMNADQCAEMIRQLYR